MKLIDWFKCEFRDSFFWDMFKFMLPVGFLIGLLYSLLVFLLGRL